MSRVNATMPTEAIQIEDEVWQDAFVRREPRRRTTSQARPQPGPEPHLGARLAPSAPVARELAGDSDTPARRTIKIQGRGAERNLSWPETNRRRPRPRAYERAGFRPDRLAMWAVVLGFLLVLAAMASGHS
jgi:hypothetical protein